jgi:DNA-binding response OmpR family regulator
VKPVGFHELVARIRAITRRVNQPAPATNGSRLTGSKNQLQIDHTARRATINGEPMVLTAKEFDLLCLLAANPDVVLRRDAIIRAIWGTDYYGSTKTLDTHVSALRRKLGDHNWIESVRRVGFRWVNQQ